MVALTDWFANVQRGNKRINLYVGGGEGGLKDNKGKGNAVWNTRSVGEAKRYKQYSGEGDWGSERMVLICMDATSADHAAPYQLLPLQGVGCRGSENVAKVRLVSLFR